VLPGLIDIHTHGIGFNFIGECGLEEYAELEAKAGATTVYATLFDSPDNTEAALKRYVKDLKSSPRLAKQIPGFRLEAPYLARTGAGQGKHLAPITQETTARLLAAGKGHVKIWDISPELESTPEAVSYLTRKGVMCTMAHTQATIDQARLAVDAGMASVTHLFDTFVVPEMVDAGVYPAGLIDYLLVEDRVCCEIVADGTHVHPLLVQQAMRCKSTWRIVFVTDSNLGAGLPSGRYTITDWGEVEVSGSNDGVRLVAREMGLAGSALTPVDLFRNAIEMFGLTWGEAARVCSETPARLLGLNKGAVSVGKDADFTILDEKLEVAYTIAGGEVLYAR
jgi:N-acetylglucosamine-6-phosphate deacetylase